MAIKAPDGANKEIKERSYFNPILNICVVVLSWSLHEMNMHRKYSPFPILVSNSCNPHQTFWNSKASYLLLKKFKQQHILLAPKWRHRLDLCLVRRHFSFDMSPECCTLMLNVLPCVTSQDGTLEVAGNCKRILRLGWHETYKTYLPL